MLSPDLHDRAHGRHAGNMLVRRPRGSSSSGGGGGLARLAEARLELCPIDHGFCLPEGLEPPYFEWLHWPQVLSLEALLRSPIEAAPRMARTGNSARAWGYCLKQHSTTDPRQAVAIR